MQIKSCAIDKKIENGIINWLLLEINVDDMLKTMIDVTYHDRRQLFTQLITHRTRIVHHEGLGNIRVLTNY